MTNHAHPHPEVITATARIGTEHYATTVAMHDDHALTADEPEHLGGTDHGASPMNLLMGAIASCKAITMRMYADRKGLPMTGASVTATHHRVKAAELGDEGAVGLVDLIECEITIDGPELTEPQRAKLYDIANRCPVHRIAVGESVIRSTLTD